MIDCVNIPEIDCVNIPVIDCVNIPERSILSGATTDTVSAALDPGEWRLFLRRAACQVDCQASRGGYGAISSLQISLESRPIRRSQI